MLGLLFGDNGHRNGRKDPRSKTYRCDDSDSDSDFEAPPEHKVFLFGHPMPVADFNLENYTGFEGKKGRQGQHHSGQRMQHQDRVMAPKLTRY
ncbi:hypothetical protein DY000_02062978 [Brassica cretica]|uniref:Uncharacterized protein n=1 Tax=Brassica cretica TaxID=69181 RepID=A0ABQ7AWD6_BRACR|nr:hypothetical protein DY000_02062978 [Brassica cretica]